MSNIDYSKYNITSTSQFDDGLAQLRDDSHVNELKKLFRLIQEIIEGIDMYEREYSRPLKGSDKILHIHLDGKQTGDIVFLYKVNGHDIDLDLKLYNITDHKNLDRVSKPKFTKRQGLHDFDVVENKYTRNQLNYAEDCYLELISDYKFHQLSGSKRSEYSNKYLQDYFNNVECEDVITFDEFLEMIQYFESRHKKSIFGSLNFSNSQHTSAITDREERYIMQIFNDYLVNILDVYIETEVDEYGDTYEYMYVKASFEDFREMKLLESELYSLDSLFSIIFEIRRNGLGRYGRTYQFSHYFE